jgi:endoribonuclease Dicer
MSSSALDDNGQNKDAVAKIRTRAYQQEMLEASLRGNIICCISTGAGKTHIAVLRLKAEIERERKKVGYIVS